MFCQAVLAQSLLMWVLAATSHGAVLTVLIMYKLLSFTHNPGSLIKYLKGNVITDELFCEVMVFGLIDASPRVKTCER